MSRPAISFTALLAALVLAAPASACDGVDVRPAAANLAQVAETTVCLLNEQRAAQGLAPLSQNPLLAAAASRHNRNMVALGFFDHTGRDGSNITDRIGATGYLVANAAWTIGENLAWGTGALGTPQAIVSAWMQSEGHRANILKTEFREIGIAVDIGVPDRSLLQLAGATFTTEFGTVAAPVAPAAPVVKRPPHAQPKKRPRCKTRKQKRTRACRKLARRR